MRAHGGPDQHGVPRHDFSSNSNSCGPCPAALAAVLQADASRYPDAGYTALRRQLAAFHGVAVQRVLLAASASEFIFRITALAAQRGAGAVWLPPHSYGDYAQAAQAWKLPMAAQPAQAQLRWACEPSSPLGAAQQDLEELAPTLGTGVSLLPPEGAELARGGPSQRSLPDTAALCVLDRAYEPLRLSGALALPRKMLQQFWQLWTPNKALGLTGVRAAYVIAPPGADLAIAQLENLAPSWPVGAHGVAMLQAWCEPVVQQWLAQSLATLREWKQRQQRVCESMGWTVLPGSANFFVCRVGPEAPAPDPGPGAPASARRHGLRVRAAMADLRGRGIKLRDCASFGLPGRWRLSVQPPASQDALHQAWQQLLKAHP
jgi:histidinol-phosphate aminotransferase